MGYDIECFQCTVDDELICSICNGVLKDPLQAQSCEHSFCSKCISEWLKEQTSCPVCRSEVLPNDLKPVARILRNLLAKLTICCENKKFGCTLVIRLDQLPPHLLQCEFNPKRLVPCSEGCNMVIPLDEFNTHNCIRELCLKLETQNVKVRELQQQIDWQHLQLQNQKVEINMLKDFFRTMSSYASSMRSFSGSPHPRVSESSQHEFHGWLASLPVARVTMWGGMISTPDAILQAAVRQCLTDMGCAPNLLNELMENAHERKWPTGLNTLETRQMNRHRYDQFMCRRIPGKQAVMVFACENQHMPDSMISQPGIIIIFAHGVD